MSYTYPRFVDYLDADSVSQHLHCPICYEVFQSPIRTPCEHHFCRSCCNEIQSAASIAASVALEVLQCPVCRHIFPLANLVPDRLVQMLTDELIVRCFGAEDGCAWTGPRDRLTVHSTSCEHAPIACSEEAVDAILCKMFLPRRLLAQHKATECLAKLYPKATLAYIGQPLEWSISSFFPAFTFNSTPTQITNLYQPEHRLPVSPFSDLPYATECTGFETRYFWTILSSAAMAHQPPGNGPLGRLLEPVPLPDGVAAGQTTLAHALIPPVVKCSSSSYVCFLFRPTDSGEGALCYISIRFMDTYAHPSGLKSNEFALRHFALMLGFDLEGFDTSSIETEEVRTKVLHRSESLILELRVVAGAFFVNFVDPCHNPEVNGVPF